MKIQISSGLHLEMRSHHEPELHDFFPVEDRDVLVLAGDIGTYMRAWSFIEQELRRSPVIYVPGNHEYYSWQTKLLREEADLVDVVITHWPPTRDAIAPRFKGDGMNSYFVNDREDLVEDIGAQFWISSHVHDPYRAVVGNTLVIGNPTGYPREAPESGLFRPDFAIEVEPYALMEWED